MNTSAPPASGVMKPKPFLSSNHFMRPVMRIQFSKFVIAWRGHAVNHARLVSRRDLLRAGSFFVLWLCAWLAGFASALLGFFTPGCLVRRGHEGLGLGFFAWLGLGCSAAGRRSCRNFRWLSVGDRMRAFDQETTVIVRHLMNLALLQQPGLAACVKQNILFDFNFHTSWFVLCFGCRLLIRMRLSQVEVGDVS